MKKGNPLKLENLSEKIHKIYCKQYLKDNGKPYWTNGDYYKLSEETKEYDRNIARFIFKRDKLQRAKGFQDGYDEGYNDVETT